MRHWLRTGVSLVVLLGSVVMAEPAAVVLEQAIRQEQTAGDIDGAMKLYQQIIDDAQANRPAQAQAMYRLALCQQKKGEKVKAVELLERVVQQYPEQQQTVGQAQDALGKLQPTQAVGTPFVVKTTPEAFAEDVDPALDRISVTFSERMTDLSWSWTGGGETMPKSDRPSYDVARKTCTLPVKLEPGKVYWVGVNSPSFRNFKSVAGVPAPWYAIVFATRSADGTKTPIPQEMLDQAKQINEAHRAAREAAAALGTQATKTPFVVKTVPAAFANDVDPELDRMSVTFDQKMADRSWSWTGGGDSSPKSEAPAYDAGKMTCSRKVTLEPGKVYWVGVNSPSHRNFKSAAGVPTPWYIIVFATRSADGKPTPIPQEMLSRAKPINDAHVAARGAATQPLQ